MAPWDVHRPPAEVGPHVRNLTQVMELTVFSTRTRMLGTATAVLSVGLLAACSGGSSTPAADSSSGSKPLAGVSVTVGSKDFTENILVGKMLVQALRPRARRSPTRRTSAARP